MSSGLLQQMGAKGIQNIHLDIKPEMSYWKRIYKRPAAFAEESIDQNIPNMTWGAERQVQISRSGDLITKTHLALTVNLCTLAVPGDDTVNWTKSLGHAMLVNCRAAIGNNEIDSFDGDLLECQHEVSSDVNKNIDELILRSNDKAQLVAWTTGGNTLDANGNAVVQLYVNLPFWYSQAASQALPLISLQYHDLNVSFRLRAQRDLLQFSNANNTTLSAVKNGLITDANILNSIIFLDSLERKLFAANAHEYLIKNYQSSDYTVKAAGAARVQAQLVFTHPCSYFMFFLRKTSNVSSLDYFNFERTAGLGDDTITSATISFNGAQREKPRGPLFFRVMQAERFFNRTPSLNVYMYSFARSPLSWFPSGSVNLSRIDTTTVELTFPTTDANGAAYGEATLKFMAVNFNIVRLSGGLALNFEGQKSDLPRVDKYLVGKQFEFCRLLMACH